MPAMRMAMSGRNIGRGWKAGAFIIGVEFSERLAYYAIAGNLISYLTGVWHQGLAVAAKTVNIWSGVTTVMAVVGAFLADAYFGRYRMVLLSTVVYIAGLGLLTLSVSLSLSRTSKALFYLALYLIAAGTGGHKPSLQAFGADQFEEDGSQEMRKKKASFFNWWYAGISGGVVLGVTVVAFVQDDVSWGIGYGIPTGVMLIALLVFVFGTPFYIHAQPLGSPLTSVLRVVVAATLKRGLDLPPDHSLLYEKHDLKDGQRLLSHTNKLRFMDKAAIKEPPDDQRIQGNPWRLCTVTEVEETKLLINMFPVWASCLMYGIVIAQGTTFFIKQGSSMDRRIGNHTQIPPASLIAVSAVTNIVLVIAYDRYFVPQAKRITRFEQGITVTQRIGVGMFFAVLCTGVAALVERKRLQTVKLHGLMDKPSTTVPMSVFWLLPQFIFLGFSDVFALVGQQEFFYTEVPDSMRSLGISFYFTVFGVGSFLSSLLITIVEKASQQGGRRSWFASTINKSRLDYFYWLLSIFGLINLCFFVCVTRRYTFKKVREREGI